MPQGAPHGLELGAKKKGTRRPAGGRHRPNRKAHEHQTSRRRRWPPDPRFWDNDPPDYSLVTQAYDCRRGPVIAPMPLRSAAACRRRTWTPADRGYDAARFRDAMTDKGTRPCNPGANSRGKPRQPRQASLQIPQRHRNHRRQARRSANRQENSPWRWFLIPLNCCTTRYDRCLKVCLSAIALAATVIFCHDKKISSAANARVQCRPAPGDVPESGGTERATTGGIRGA